MQCACPECGIVMGWRILGTASECRCSECGYQCSACLGTNCVLNVDEIRKMAEIWGIDARDEEPT